MFAIVITLLVLELPVPPSTEPILPALAESWPDFLGYLISFAFIGGIWISHAGLTRYMRRGDVVSFRLNLVLLLFVSLLPFSTHLMVAHMHGADASVAVAIYGLNLFMESALITALLHHAAHDRHLVVDDVDDARVSRAYRQRRAYLVADCFGNHRGLYCAAGRRRHLHCPGRRVPHPAVDRDVAEALRLWL